MTKRRDDDAVRPPEPRDDDVDETSEESFPASDSPGWAPLRAGTPRDTREERRAREGERGPPAA